MEWTRIAAVAIAFAGAPFLAAQDTYPPAAEIPRTDPSTGSNNARAAQEGIGNPGFGPQVPNMGQGQTPDVNSTLQANRVADIDIGWVGLLGLAGLFGLFGRKQTRASSNDYAQDQLHHHPVSR
jgi:hypothetical protein